MWLVSSLPPLRESAHSCKCVPGDSFSLRQGTHWLGHRESACPSSPRCWDYKQAHYNAVCLWVLGVGHVPSHFTTWAVSSVHFSFLSGFSYRLSLLSLWPFILSSGHQALKFQAQILHMRKFKWSNGPLCPCWSQLMPKGTSEAVDHHENDWR